MAELKFEAPLAKFDEPDDWGNSGFISNRNILNEKLNLNCRTGKEKKDPKIYLEKAMNNLNLSYTNNNGLSANGAISPNCNTMLKAKNLTIDVANKQNGESLGVDLDKRSSTIDTVYNFNETFGGSLEDLVNTFDEKITKCFGNYDENVEELAPVQVRSQDDIMNECQMWWTITGNFGNILPIDWSKSYTRQMQMPTLNLDVAVKQQKLTLLDIKTSGDDLTSEDEAVASDLDMHALILSGLNTDNDVPIKSVEEVMKEIDDILEEVETPLEHQNFELEFTEKAREVLGNTLYTEKMEYLSITELNELLMEIELLIRELSETLINELAFRDELEYEKELKNSFISLLLTVQNKRRQYHVEKKRGKFLGADPKYLTTVIPYHLETGTPTNQSLQVLIKILKAINEDSPTVPTLLTDYILKVLCPT